MAEIGPAIKVVYWNTLASADDEQKVAFATALIDETEPDALILAECTETMGTRLEDKYEFVNYEVDRTHDGRKQGLCIIGAHALDIKRDSPWTPLHKRNRVNHLKRLNIAYDDERQYVRFELDDPRPQSVGRIAIYGAHITHPHFIWMPSLGMHRREEWQEHAALLNQESLPYLWLADTNTFFTQTVRQKLDLSNTYGRLLDHENGPTWSLTHFKLTPPMLYLDRVAASEDLANETRLITLPHTVAGIVNPSDHRAIMVVVQ